VHRAELARNGVRMLKGVEYLRIDDAGLHVLADAAPMVISADTIIVCAGQEPRRWRNGRFHHIGGAREAGELDAERAMREGAEFAATL
jgi:2,4-dienoyl-CoA reductase (NADPH2)